MGIKCASEVFQREMIHQFVNMEGVEIAVDDLLVHRRNKKEHDERLRQELRKAREINLKLNEKKCKFSCKEVDYVGHTLIGEGAEANQRKSESHLNDSGARKHSRTGDHSRYDCVCD